VTAFFVTCSASLCTDMPVREVRYYIPIPFMGIGMAL
jgi:hypothetical protein